MQSYGFLSWKKLLSGGKKVNNEVATMAYIAESTSISVPLVRGNGVCSSGPYIIMLVFDIAEAQ